MRRMCSSSTAPAGRRTPRRIPPSRCSRSRTVRARRSHHRDAGLPRTSHAAGNAGTPPERRRNHPGDKNPEEGRLRFGSIPPRPAGRTALRHGPAETKADQAPSLPWETRTPATMPPPHATAAPASVTTTRPMTASTLTGLDRASCTATRTTAITHEPTPPPAAIRTQRRRVRPPRNRTRSTPSKADHAARSATSNQNPGGGGWSAPAYATATRTRKSNPAVTVADLRRLTTPQCPTRVPLGSHSSPTRAITAARGSCIRRTQRHPSGGTTHRPCGALWGCGAGGTRTHDLTDYESAALTN